MSEQSGAFRWTDGVTLKEYIECLIGAQDKAVLVALAAMEKRLDGMNEFRDAMKDQSTKFPTRDELHLIIGPILNDIRVLRETKASIEGAANQQSVNVAMLLAMAGVVISIVSILVKVIVS